MQIIDTKYGQLMPQHTTDDLRKKEILPVVLHDNGTPKSVPLENQTIIVTPAGKIPAELITFHENGSVNRVFPLNGKLSGYWSESDEMQLAEPVTLTTPSGEMRTKIISISFYENGALRSMTLCPGETISLSTQTGFFEIRIGISFTPDGAIKSLEPAKPTSVKTPAGEITAYDPDALGVNGDTNSLVFNDAGEVVSLTTTMNSIIAVHSDGRTTFFTPEIRESYCSETENEIIPMSIRFGDKTVTIRITPESHFQQIPRARHLFFSKPYLPQLAPYVSKPCC